jgi:hypothetical protein
MPDIDPPQADHHAEQARPRNQEPLYLRMYFQDHLIELVRLFGYGEIPLTEAREKLKPLVDKYGQKKMETAAEEIIFIDSTKSPEVARLTDHARKLARQLLGPPPEMGSRQPPVTAPPTTVASNEPLPAADPPDRDAPAQSKRKKQAARRRPKGQETA